MLIKLIVMAAVKGKMHTNTLKVQTQRERGQWAVYYTGPQSFMITFSYSLTTLVNLLNFDWLVY